MDSSQSGFRLVDVLKGCLLSPLLFNIFLEAVIAIALYGNNSSAMINAIEILSNLRFADDIADVLAETASDLLTEVSRRNCENFNLHGNANQVSR